MTAPLFAVASGKGGVGKTVLSIALTQCFAANAQRTLLVDGDLGLANIDVQLGLAPKGDLFGVIAGGLTLADAVAAYDGGADVRRGFDVISGRSGHGALRALPQADLELLGRSLRMISAAYDRTVVDLGAGLDPTMLELATAAGRVLVVLTDEPTSLTDAYALIKLLSQRAAPPALAIAVNMAATPAEGRRAYTALERACTKFLGSAPPLAGIVRRDPAVQGAIRAQMPYLTRSPTGAAAADIAGLSAALDTAFAPVRAPRLRGLR
ncbi:MAG: AAA family ATPase [Micropepsaceae bacterium]